MNKLAKLSVLGITLASFLGANIAYSAQSQHSTHNMKKAKIIKKDSSNTSPKSDTGKTITIIPPPRN